jgi:hypothetical protein
VTALPGITEPFCRPDQKRIYYNGNRLLFDEKKAGFSKAAAIKALRAEGVPITAPDVLQEQHRFQLYHEPQWWHHAPVIPDALPGNQQLLKTTLVMPLLFEDVPELNEQYALAFEKVWAHKAELARM